MLWWRVKHTKYKARQPLSPTPKALPSSSERDLCFHLYSTSHDLYNQLGNSTLGFLKDSTRSSGTFGFLPPGWKELLKRSYNSSKQCTRPRVHSSPADPVHCIQVVPGASHDSPGPQEPLLPGAVSLGKVSPPSAGCLLTCSCSISLYALSSSRALKRLCSRYMRVPSETGCTAKAFRKAGLPSFSGSLFLASSKERYCCP